MRCGCNAEHKVMRRLPGAVLQAVMANVTAFFILFPRPRTVWKKESYDCAVVCGYFANEDGTPSAMMKTRVERAAELWRAGRIRYLIMSGAGVHNQYVEADVMSGYAQKLGVPRGCILTETRAVSTYHNLLYSKEIMRRQGLRDCVVVTNGWHLRKADHYARKQKLDYVMSRAENPEGQSPGERIFQCLRTSVAMYLNVFRGLY